MSNKILETLEKPEYLEVLLCVIDGKNYATSIAKTLEKKQPTVTEQLIKLEKLKLIKPLKREKAQKYEANWNIILEVFYDILNDVLKLREEYITKEDLNIIKKQNIKQIIPPELIKIFLGSYFSCFQDIGGKRKGFDELIFSFFVAINNIEKSERKKLTKKFGINYKYLSIVSNIMEIEDSIVERTALILIE